MLETLETDWSESLVGKVLSVYSILSLIHRTHAKRGKRKTAASHGAMRVYLQLCNSGSAGSGDSFINGFDIIRKLYIHVQMHLCSLTRQPRLVSSLRAQSLSPRMK